MTLPFRVIKIIEKTSQHLINYKEKRSSNMTQLSHRKANASLTLTQADGTPVSGKTLHVKQKSHDFLFGCCAFESIELLDPATPPERKEFLAELMDKWLALFNYTTLPFYWKTFEPTEGNPRTQAIKRAAVWLKERNIELKGHPLCWHTWTADWLMEHDNAEILRRQLARIDRDVSDFRGLIDMWDVINEAVIMPVFDKYDNGITRICKEYGRIKLIKKVFDEARKINPNATLLINDFNTSQAYEILIEGCLEAGVPIDVIGIQSHQHQGYWGTEKIYEVLERFSRFNIPIHFTENTFVSGQIMPAYIDDLNDYQVTDWPTTPEGEDRQARETEEMFRILFGHPLVQGFTTWDFTDNAWLNAPAGYLRKDNSKKPSYEVLDQMINKDWTTDLTCTSDENGTVSFAGFKGDYEITCDDQSFSLSLKQDTVQKLILK